MSLNEKSDVQGIPSIFFAYEDEKECNATIEYRQRLFDQKNPETPMKELFMYDLTIPDVEKAKIAIPKVYYEEEPRRHLPKWIRQELKRDKRDWKQIHHTMKRTPMYAPSYFSPLEEVQKAELRFSNYDQIGKPQNKEGNENSEDINNNTITQNKNESSNSQSKKDYSSSQYNEENAILSLNEGGSSSQKSEEKSLSGNGKKNSFSGSFEGSSFSLSDE
ncbi:hypothetical protein M9Y10_009463 [Tritrichomonas musculus]|uniref:PSP proline-rich domain-containing protein n=1 Tax=Tritrichomonas musculus TaxID=1915356 RepID=A0ABR2IPT2_9EUKA